MVDKQPQSREGSFKQIKTESISASMLETQAERRKGQVILLWVNQKTKPLMSYCFVSHCDKGREFWKGECDLTKRIIIPLSL